MSKSVFTSEDTLHSSTYSESTKTPSSKSYVSASVLERDEDLTKNNVASPIDLECHIQEERINKLLAAAIYKCKLSIALPILMKDISTLNSILSVNDYDDVMFIYAQYSSPLPSNSLFNIEAISDIKSGNVSLKHRLNPELGHLLYILNSYPQLKQLVEQTIDEMKTDYALEKPHPPNPSLEYLLTLEQFCALMSAKMAGTAADELAVQIKTRNIEQCNAKLIANINDNTRTLKTEQEEFEKTLAKKTETIAAFEHEVSIYGYEAGARRRKNVLDSERQMVLMSRAHKTKYEMLKEEQAETFEGYKTVLQQNLKNEKTQRLRRCKAETQLQSWLQKYDIEMTAKQSEMDKLIEKYDEEAQKVEELEKQLAEQDKEYLPLMEEREKEYHQEMTDKMEKFLVEHAARVIQSAWRTVLLNRTEKKKLKKLLKKKEAADNIVAAKAAKIAAAKARVAAAAARAQKKAAKAAAKEAKKMAALEAKINAGAKKE